MIRLSQIIVNQTLKGKTILLRVDLNVPVIKGKVQDYTRIKSVIPSIKHIIDNKGKVVLCSHFGRPIGKEDKQFSLKPMSKILSKELGVEIKFSSDCVGEETTKKKKALKEGEVLLLENLRFYESEEKNEKEFSKILASKCDFYVNDAFSCSHRNHASVTKITNFLPSYCGLQMDTEITALKKITSNIERPITCIIGGSKISTKINLIKNLIPKFENIVIVGGMANNILEYKGYKIGKSIKESNCKKTIEEIFSLAKINNCNIFYPTDVSVGKNFNDKSKIKNLSEIENDDLILDIGDETIKTIVHLIKKSKTILWNGPAGYFENSNFAKGSIQIAQTIVNTENKIYSVVGGGDTIAVLNKANTLKQFNFVSTAGGAFLEYLEGKEIPGIRALN